MGEGRWENGIRIIREVEGEQGVTAVEGLKGLSPDLAKYMVEFVFGDIYGRTAFDKKLRSIAAIAGLTVLGSAPQTLKAHIQQAVKEGCSEDEIIETIIFMTVISGFPSAVQAMALARQAFQEM